VRAVKGPLARDGWPWRTGQARRRVPLLLEGEAGVGKTEVGKTLARIVGADLIRLQCYEGIDASQALYEWDYARQLLYARALQAGEIERLRRDRMAEGIRPEPGSQAGRPAASRRNP
jgi:dynein-related subfamily AAA family protein